MARGGYFCIGGTDYETFGHPVLRIVARLYDPAWIGVPDDWAGEEFDPLPPSAAELAQFAAAYPLFDPDEARTLLLTLHSLTGADERAAHWRRIEDLHEAAALAMADNDPALDGEEPG